MAGTLFNLPKVIAWDNGTAQGGAKLNFYQTGTSTPQNVYTDIALSVAHSNPVVADSEGVFAPVYLDPSLPDYRVTFTDSADTTIYQVDDVPSSDAGGQSLTLEAATPYIDLDESDASANNGSWRLSANSEQLLLQTANDALDTFADIMVVDRTATTVDTVNFKPTTLQYNGTEVATTALTDAATANDDRETYGVGLGWTSDTTLADYSKEWTLTAGLHYQVEAELVGFENGGGLKLQFVCSQTPADTGYLYYRWIDETGTTGEDFQTPVQAVLSLTAMTNNENFKLRIVGQFQANATTGGTFKLQAAQVASSANTTYIRGGSSITLHEEN